MPVTLLRSALLRLLATAICAVSVVPVAAASAAPPSGPHPADSVVAAEIERKSAARANGRSQAERARRERSRREFRNLSPTEALGLATRRHPEQVVLPALRAPAPPEDREIIGFEGEFTARIAKPDGSDPQLVTANVPLRARDADGDKRPVDLTLERAGGAFRPLNPIADVRLGAELGEGLALLGPGVVVRPVGAGGHADALLSGDTVFYGNAFTDADVLVRPGPTGFSVHVQLRSAESPERLALEIDVPAGVTLRAVEGGIELRRAGETVAVVTAPVAWDADRRSVELDWRLDGDRLVIDVAHRGEDLAYPLLVDPDVVETFEWERYGANNEYGNFAGWNWRSSGAFANHGWNGNSTWLGNGLYIRNLGTTYHYNAGDSGVWWWRAPGFARLKSVEWNLFDQDAVEGTCTELGIAKWPSNQPGPIAWQPGNPSWSHCGVYYGQYARSWNGNGEPGDEAEFKVQAAPWGGNRTYFAAQVGVVYLYMNDPDVPTIGSGLPNTWVNWASTKTLDTWAVDPSTGISSMALTAAGWSGANIGPETYTRCSRTYMCPRGHATDGSTRNATVGNMPEGINTISVTARDPAGNQRTSAETPQMTGQGLRAAYYNNWDFTSLALARVDPTIDFNWAGQPHPAIASDTFSVRWTGQIEAPVSGTYQFQTSTDDGVRLWVHDINSPKIDDWRSHGETVRTSGNMTMTAGVKYRVVMEYFDDTSAAVARLRWKTPTGISFVTIPSSNLTPPGGWQLKLDRSGPVTNLSGPLKDRENQTLPPGSYDLHVDTTDGTAGTPAAERSGVKSIEIFVDDIQKDYVEQPCPNGNCALSRTWTMHTGDYAGGDHRIDVVTLDQLGNQTTKTFVVRTECCALPSTSWLQIPLTTDVAFGDVNGDGAEDAVLRHRVTGRVDVGLARDKQFGPLVEWGTFPITHSVRVADMNGDRLGDLIGRNSLTGDVLVALSEKSDFADGASWGTWATDHTFEIADADGDALSDVLGRQGSTGAIRVGLSNGSGFDTATQWSTLADGYDLAFGDVDGDHAVDQVARNRTTGDVNVGLSNIDVFTTPTRWTTIVATNQFHVQDANGDLLADLVVRDPNNGTTIVRTSNDQAFSNVQTFTTWAGDADFLAHDVNGDGQIDLVGRTASDQIRVALNNMPLSEPVASDEAYPTDVDAPLDEEDIAAPPPPAGGAMPRAAGAPVLKAPPTGSPRIAFQDDAPLVWRPEDLGFSGDRAQADQQVQRAYDRIVETAGTVVRFNIYWGRTENEDGTFVWDPRTPEDPWEFDRAVDEAIARGLHVHVTISGIRSTWDCAASNRHGRACPHNPDGTPDFATAPRRTETTGYNPDPAQFKHFVTEVVKHFGTRVTSYSLWNEPNLRGFLATTNSREAPTDLYRALYLQGYAGAKTAIPGFKPRVFIGELSESAMAGRMSPNSHLGGKRQLYTALDFLEEVVRPRTSTSPWVYTDGVAIHPYQHRTKPYTAGDRLEVGIGKLNGAMIDPRNVRKGKVNRTGVNRTLNALFKKRGTTGATTGTAPRWLSREGSMYRPPLYLTEFGYFNKPHNEDELEAAGNGRSSTKNYWHTEDTRRARFRGAPRRPGALDRARAGKARWMLIFHLDEVPVPDFDAQGRPVGKDDYAWDSGLIGVAPVLPDESVGEAPVTGDRNYGKDPSGGDLTRLNFPQPRRAYCAIWRWAASPPGQYTSSYPGYYDTTGDDCD